jgi:hypothetical protein
MSLMDLSWVCLRVYEQVPDAHYRTKNDGLIPLAGLVFTHTRHEHGDKNTASLTGAVSASLGLRAP